MSGLFVPLNRFALDGDDDGAAVVAVCGQFSADHVVMVIIRSQIKFQFAYRT